MGRFMFEIACIIYHCVRRKGLDRYLGLYALRHVLGHREIAWQMWWFRTSSFRRVPEREIWQQCWRRRNLL